MTVAAHEHHTTIATAVALVHFPAIALASRLAVLRDDGVVDPGPAVVVGLRKPWPAELAHAHEIACA